MRGSRGAPLLFVSGTIRREEMRCEKMRCVKITVTGLVQGVGYRPFVAELAESCGIGGQVKKCGRHCEDCRCRGAGSTGAFCRETADGSARRSRVDEVRVSQASSKEEPFGDEDLPCGGMPRRIRVCRAGGRSFARRKARRFRIVESSPGEEEVRLLPADLPVCPSCERELLDPNNRRFRYPFISCVACGPRFSILKAVPYDRDTITMGDFCHVSGLCRRVPAEGKYPKTRPDHRLRGLRAEAGRCGSGFPGKRCWECHGKYRPDGGGGGGPAADDPGDSLRKIAAIKDIGGFSLRLPSDDPEPSRRLRIFKDRERKPFAVMFADVAAAREYCEISEQEEELLCSLARPFVLLKKKRDSVLKSAAAAIGWACCCPAIRCRFFF